MVLNLLLFGDAVVLSGARWIYLYSSLFAAAGTRESAASRRGWIF